ncbi:Glutamate dehydrogenase [Carpediemonas membranifera]|uniref:Glutamate dehydrogenase n=1 Tax=Carpediemonas membranifera TaxID=201153 RepID=A0A8J6AT29_9EUKA|nr:Glutamate dehydrogenase [Carpediemonas membranifera]|eukprot:KAG9391685.1 Glutamate dehydrogenase [Carpediemonas membranifera]
MSATIENLIETIKRRDPGQPEFQQAAFEVIESVRPLLEKEPKYIPIMERMLEPERVIQFRVPWINDKGEQEVNRAFRVEFNSALGPYKGGLRFHPSVNLSIIKFLGFEQILKNSLTTLQMGAGKGGSDFDPKGKSDNEVMRFCQSFMTELSRHIGANTDVPAGDIGVGGREIGYMFGQYKRVRNVFEGVLTGKGLNWGGSLIRPEATGYGAVYYAQNMMEANGMTLKGKRCAVSGSGNVAQYAIEKLLDLGAIPVTCSDSSGYILEENGFTRDQLVEIMRLKNVARARISEYTKFSKTAKFFPGKRPWEVACDAAFPCATQNEVEKTDAEALVKGGCKCISEGANMPTTPEGIEVYLANGVLYGPAKAANAGGVAVSGLEMAQNSQRLAWTREDVDAKLASIMKNIFDNCANNAKLYADKPTNYMVGANIAGFVKVADAMLDQGCV